MNLLIDGMEMLKLLLCSRYVVVYNLEYQIY
jgi:hypothetical protein